MLAREENLADISLREGGMGIYSHQTIVNHNFEQATSWPDSVWTSGRDMSFAKGSHEVLESTWQDLRPEPIPDRAKRTYWMVDSIQTMPQYKFLEGFAMLAGTGTSSRSGGVWAFYDSYSTNPIEGERYSLGVQTSDDFSRKVWLRSFWPTARWTSNGSTAGLPSGCCARPHAPKCLWSTSETWISSA